MPQVRHNKRRAAVLLLALFALFTVVGSAIALLAGLGLVGVVVALVVAAALTAAARLSSEPTALRVTRARPADPTTHARLHNLVEGLCATSGLPVPRLYVVDDPALNAFAAGHDPRHASLTVTTGLLDAMSRIELEGVLAHELSHIRSADIAPSTLAVTTVGLAAVVCDIAVRFVVFGARRVREDDGAGPLRIAVSLLFIWLTPLAVVALRRTVAPRREPLADLAAVETTRYPPGLIGALEKVRDGSAVVREGHRATAHLWMQEPMPHHDDAPDKARWSHLFDTHPPIEDRIAALREL